MAYLCTNVWKEVCANWLSKNEMVLLNNPISWLVINSRKVNQPLMNPYLLAIFQWTAVLLDLSTINLLIGTKQDKLFKSRTGQHGCEYFRQVIHIYNCTRHTLYRTFLVLGILKSNIYANIHSFHKKHQNVKNKIQRNFWCGVISKQDSNSRSKIRNRHIFSTKLMSICNCNRWPK